MIEITVSPRLEVNAGLEPRGLRLLPVHYQQRPSANCMEISTALRVLSQTGSLRACMPAQPWRRRGVTRSYASYCKKAWAHTSLAQMSWGTSVWLSRGKGTRGGGRMFGLKEFLQQPKLQLTPRQKLLPMYTPVKCSGHCLSLSFCLTSLLSYLRSCLTCAEPHRIVFSHFSGEGAQVPLPLRCWRWPRNPHIIAN